MDWQSVIDRLLVEGPVSLLVLFVIGKFFSENIRKSDTVKEWKELYDAARAEVEEKDVVIRGLRAEVARLKADL